MGYLLTLRTSSSRNILANAGISVPGRLSSLPSWAWSFNTKRMATIVAGGIYSASVDYSASRDSDSVAIWDPLSNDLQVRGHIADHVHTLRPTVKSNSLDSISTWYLETCSIIDAFRKDANLPGRIISGDELWRTLIADRTYRGRKIVNDGLRYESFHYWCC